MHCDYFILSTGVIRSGRSFSRQGGRIQEHQKVDYKQSLIRSGQNTSPAAWVDSKT